MRGLSRAVAGFARQLADTLGADFYEYPPDIVPSRYASTEEHLAYLRKERIRSSE